jgi:hypothetical protein
MPVRVIDPVQAVQVNSGMPPGLVSVEDESISKVTVLLENTTPVTSNSPLYGLSAPALTSTPSTLIVAPDVIESL